MSQFSLERWRVLSPYLDRALETTGDERAAWLESMRAEDPTVAADLEALLDECTTLRREHFLEEGPPLPAVASIAGQSIGAYTLISLLGNGGMGSVWLARRNDGWFAGHAALKLLHPSIIGLVGEARFKREGAILGQLKHPHIAHLIDAGVSPVGQPYLVLEHVEGQRIDDYCDAGRLGVVARVRLVLDVLGAVAHAHAKLIVHRDIKPSNLLVSREGRVKLLDFGIAKLIGGDAGPEVAALTRDDARPLTPEYAAPEQIAGGAVTAATDVYAVGVLLYVLLAGRHPAGAARRVPADLVKAIVETDPPRLSAAARTGGPAETIADNAARRGTTPDRLQRALRGDLDTIVAKALKKTPEERYPSATALADDLRSYLANKPISARPDTLGYRTAKLVRRNRLPMALAAVALIALLGGLAGTIWQARATARQRDLALAQLARAEGINDFNVFLLGQAVPGGEKVSVHDLLARAERVVDKRVASHEPVAVELLTTIGGIYRARTEDKDARRVLKRAYDASQRFTDPGMRARASCAWAQLVAREGSVAAAHGMIDAALATMSDDARFHDRVAVCLVAKANVAMLEGVPDQVAEMAQKALARLDKKPSARPEERIDALQLLATARSMQGDAASADRIFAEVVALLERIGWEDTTNTGFIISNWATNVAHTSSLGALALQERAIKIFEGENPASVPMPMRLNHGLYLNRLARYPEARVALETVRTLSRQQGSPLILAISSQGAACACRSLGDLECARAALQDAEAALRPFPAGHAARAGLAREQGLLAAAEGRAAEARQRLSVALALHEKVPEKHLSHLETLLALAKLELELGDAGEAGKHARAVLDLAEALRSGAPRSAWVGLSQLVLGEVHEAQRDVTGAQQLFRQALDHMPSTLGDTHPAVLEARSRLGTTPRR
jgi:eukaryotic-like serine/threonine-protein kinase